MFTECPNCSAAFRVTAQVLQQANGRVRCGGCDSAFNALDYLSEKLPAADETGDLVQPAEADDILKSSQELLDTLDELAGAGDVLIEDTGTEWRVLEEIEADEAPEDAAGKTGTLSFLPAEPDEAEEADDTDEPRYDDNTPHPDNVEAGADEGLTDSDGIEPSRPPPPADDDEPVTTGVTLSEPEEWSELLDEFEDELSGEGAMARADELPLEVEEELAAIHHELSTRESPATDEEAPVLDLPLPEDDEGEEAGTYDDVFAAGSTEVGSVDHDLDEYDAAGDAAPQTAQDDLFGTGGAAASTDHDDVFAVDEEAAADAAPSADAGDEFPVDDADTSSDLFDNPPAEIESIIMEGAEVQTTGGDDNVKAVEPGTFELLDPLPDDGAEQRRRPGVGLAVSAFLLLLVLTGQVIHAYREKLSTYALFNQTIAPIYGLLGQPVTPQWDITGWQFESTSGNIAAEQNTLTIVSRIGNKAAIELPYPLVHVSLTDRFEEVIGSRVLAPQDYLAGDVDPAHTVAPGDDFTAVITVDEPAAEATGFKLNVCYRISGERVRCATEDFKD